MSTVGFVKGRLVPNAESFQKLYAEVQSMRRVRAPRDVQRTDPVVEEKFLAEWEARLREVDAVCFDLFGTALLRACLQPEDVFLFLKDVPPFDQWPFDRAQLTALRLQAEQETRAALRQQARPGQVTLREIYQRLLRENNLPAESTSACVHAEQVVESGLTHGNLPVLKLVQAAQQQNKRVLIVAETTHSPDFLYDLLNHCGCEIEAGDILTVSSLPRSGHPGLLPVLMEKKGFPPAKWLFVTHQPDSERAADMPPSEPTRLVHPYASPQAVSSRHGDPTLRATDSHLRGLAAVVTRREPETDFWFELGTTVFGPLLTGFTLWLGQQWREQKIERGFFLHNPDSLALRIYDELRRLQPDLPPVQGLPATPRVFTVPALGSSPVCTLDFILSASGERTVRHILSWLNLPVERFLSAIEQAGFRSPDSPIDRHHKSIRLTRLFRDPELLRALNERVRFEREQLLTLLKPLDLATTQPTALVDIGWNNLTHKSLVSLLHHEERDHQLHGFALATTPGAQEPLLPGYRYQSYLCHNGEPLHQLEALAACPEFLDLACAPSLDSRLHSLQKGALAFAQVWMKSNHARPSPVLPPELASESLRRLLLQPTPEEASAIGPLQAGEKITTLLPLAAFASESLEPNDLLAAYELALWKPGLLAQDSIQAWALRQLVE